jgi:hypothetical protein
LKTIKFLQIMPEVKNALASIFGHLHGSDATKVRFVGRADRKP